MVKKENFTKAELMNMLASATTSRDRNRATKLLKKFEPMPKLTLDSENDTKNFKVREFNNLQGFVCFRCDKVKQTKYKITWTTSQGVKTICHGCYTALMSRKELDHARRILSKAAAGKGLQ